MSSAEKAAAAREAGADEAIVYPPGPFDRDGQKALAQQFKDAVGPNGANVIYDPVGGEYAEPALRSIAWEGRYLVFGFLPESRNSPLNLTHSKAVTCAGSSGARSRRAIPKANAAMSPSCSTCGKRQNPAPGQRHLSARTRREAIAAMAARKVIGKLVVTLD